MALHDLVAVATATTGAGSVTLGAALPGFRTFAAAGVVDGSIVSYAIEDAGGRETGRGTYTAGTSTLTRTLKASSTGALLDLSGQAVVFITPIAEDFLPAATVVEVWAGSVVGKVIDPKTLNDAMIPTALTIAGGVVSPDCNAGINFDIASINANITIANLANKTGKLGRSGSITGKNDATAGRTVSLGTDWKKIGTTAFPTAANARWKVVYNIDANGVNYSVSVLSA